MNIDYKQNLADYILMCEKAIEIQKLHKPAICDKYICDCGSCKERLDIHYIHDYDMDKLNNRDLTNVEPHYSALVRMADVATFVAFYHGRSEEDLSYIWLPQQEDLQGMVDIGENRRLYFFDRGLSVNNGQNNFLYKIDGNSMDQLWLAFVMKEKFNKTWDGAEWIRVNQ